MKFVKAVTAIAVASALAISGAHAAGYVKLGDIKGESQAAGDANHDKWIDVLSIDWGSNKPGARQSATMTIKEKEEAILIGLLLPAVQKVRAAASTSSSRSTRAVAASSKKKAGRLTYRETQGRRTVKTWVLHDVEYARPRATGRAGATHTLDLTYGCKDWTDAAGNTGSDCGAEGNKGGNAETTWKVEKGEK